MNCFIFSMIAGLALPCLAHQHFIWRSYQDNPGIIFINNYCPFTAFVSEVWQNGGDGPSPIQPYGVTTVPLRENVGGVDVKFTQDSGPPQNPVEMSYAFDPFDTSYNFDLVAISPQPDFGGTISISPSPSTGRCQQKYWQPGSPPLPPGPQVCQAGTNLQVYLCGGPPYY